MKSFYKDFGLLKKPDKKRLNKQELYLLYKRPQRDKGANAPSYNNTYSKDVDHQADLLFLPNDNGYRYALVVTDLATRLSDAEPLKSKDTHKVAKGFERIYNRKILDKPPPSVIRGQPTTYVVQKIIGKKKVKGKIYYRVKWKGYPDSEATWEPRKNLIEDVPILVNEYENDIKRK